MTTQTLGTLAAREPGYGSSGSFAEAAFPPLVRQDGATGNPGWLPLLLILGAIAVVAYADHHMLSFSLIYLYVLPLSLSAIFLRREVGFGLIVVCILIHYFDSPRRVSLGLRLFHDLSALICFTFVVYVIHRYATQRELLVRTIADQRDRLVKDLKLAEQVQRMFLPAAPPSMAGLAVAGVMQPARWLSGDYYGYIPIDHQKLEIVVADVSGKGVPASLLMSATAAAIEIGANAGRTMPDIVNRLNREIQSVSDGTQFVTLFIAAIDTATRELRYINCGHNPALRVRRSSKTIARMDSTCPPVGLIQSKIDGVSTESLENGDVIVFYTDGVTEAMNPKEEEFGLERLSAIVQRDQALGAEELVSRIVDSARSFTGEVGFGDDVTVVVVKCQFD